MSETQTLGPWLERYLLEYIVTERNLARNTQKSYRDTFKMLVPFVSGKLRKPADRLAVRDLSSKRVLPSSSPTSRTSVGAPSRPATSA